MLSETGTLTIYLYLVRPGKTGNKQVTLLTERSIREEEIEPLLMEFIEANPKLPRSALAAEFVRRDFFTMPRP